MTDPIKFMISHAQTITDAYKIGEGPLKTWNILKDRLPETHKAMSYNSFKQYIRPFSLICEQLEQSRAMTDKPMTGPRRIDGWTVVLGKKDGYYRLNKTIEGRSHSIHIGRILDKTKAREKIAAKEIALGLRGEMRHIEKVCIGTDDPDYIVTISFLEKDPPTRQMLQDAVRELLPQFRSEPRKREESWQESRERKLRSRLQPKNP